jgi:hypothetical protein
VQVSTKAQAHLGRTSLHSLAHRKHQANVNYLGTRVKAPSAFSKQASKQAIARCREVGVRTTWLNIWVNIYMLGWKARGIVHRRYLGSYLARTGTVPTCCWLAYLCGVDCLLVVLPYLHVHTYLVCQVEKINSLPKRDIDGKTLSALLIKTKTYVFSSLYTSAITADMSNP